ncbi:alpha-amylase [Tritrichomonas musculus]|uniref:Alpha-amylase n=1 Tax=Tritrichomonas musculus TaxID=1915356 RepID=A0ABR2KE62_9EUKA
MNASTIINLVLSAVVGLGIGLLIAYGAFSGSNKTNSSSKALSKSSASLKSGYYNNTLKELPECQIFESLSCNGGYDSPGDMNEKWKDHLWNTPARNTEGWHRGFQDMQTLVGYPQLRYFQGRKSCTVTVYTKTRIPLDLTYYFNGEAQSEPTKTFDSSFSGTLKIKVVAKSGETLELDDVDFIWNVEPLKSRSGDYRNGQKGAIVELFGWPDEDIEKECKRIAEAGYLGVKLFPHQEQIMSYQPFEYEMNPWFFMYQPVSYRLQGRMGTRDQLRKMIKTCRSYGLRVYADAVINHMTAGGNDAQEHRNPGAGCVKWPGKNSSAGEDISPFYTHSYTYKYNQLGQPSNVLEYPAVPYGPMDFHCDKGCNSWGCPSNLNTGWLVGLADLDTSKEYVRTRIADFLVDLLSIGFSGFRIDAAKHIHPQDIAAILGNFKKFLGGDIPEDWITWLEVILGGEAPLLVGESEYSYTGYLTKQLENQGLSNNDIDKVKIWWAAYPSEPNTDDRYGSPLSKWRKAIQNDDHDQQNPDSTSRNMNNDGCVLARGCNPQDHRRHEIRLFTDPYGGCDNDNDYPIRLLLSSYYFRDGIKSIPDGKSDCKLCNVGDCNACRSRSYAPAYVENAEAYSGQDYTRVHRDGEIINAMRRWMHLN